MADFGEPPIVVNYFYHEQVRKSARQNALWRPDVSDFARPKSLILRVGQHTFPLDLSTRIR